MSVLVFGWVWLAALALLLCAGGWLASHWSTVRRWRYVDALLVMAAVVDHLAVGSAPRGRRDGVGGIDERVWQLAPDERVLWLVGAIDMENVK
jgi:hypothetical protein